MRITEEGWNLWAGALMVIAAMVVAMVLLAVISLLYNPVRELLIAAEIERILYVADVAEVEIETRDSGTECAVVEVNLRYYLPTVLVEGVVIPQVADSINKYTAGEGICGSINIIDYDPDDHSRVFHGPLQGWRFWPPFLIPTPQEGES